MNAGSSQPGPPDPPRFGPRTRLAVAALLFSTGGVVVKATALSGWQVACLRCGIGALTLALLLPAARRGWHRGTWLVAVAYAATLLLYAVANKLTTAANAIFLQYTAPLYVLLLGPWLLKERLLRRDLAFMVGLAAGMAAVMVGGTDASATAVQPALGNLLAATTGLSWGLTLLGLRWLETRGSGLVGGSEGGSAAGVLAGNLLAFVVGLPFALRDPQAFAAAGPADGFAVAYLGVVQVGLAYVLLTGAMRHVRALDASLLLLLELLFTPLWTWLFLGERPTSMAAIGCLVILVATIAWTAASARSAKAGAPEVGPQLG